MHRSSARSKRLSPVLKLAETRERDAAQVLAKARQRLHDYEVKLADLRAFREEYSRSLNTMYRTAISTALLQQYQKFIRQLDDGITILAEKVAGQKRLNLQDEKQWLTAKIKTDALDRLVEKLQSIEQSYLNNREANELDEHASRVKRGP